MALVSKILETTLTAGQTSVSFTDSDIPNSLIRVFASNTDVIPTSRTLIGNTLTVTYDAQTANMGVALEMQKQGLEIVDSLTSSDTDKALSAKQGKLLNDDLTTVSGDLSDLTTIVNNLDIPDSITDLDDVQITSIEDNQILIWDDEEQKFVNSNPPSGGGENYTTTETLIGKWSDGSDLYMKRVEYTVNKNASHTFTFSDGTVCMVDGFIINSLNNIRFPINCIWSNLAEEFLFDDSSFYIKTSNNIGASSTLVLFVKYVKTV